MHPYTYAISLRVVHPSIKPVEVTQTLALEPVRAWRAGNPRQTPKGAPLDGVYQESYWCSQLSLYGRREHSSEIMTLGECLRCFSNNLSPFHEFFSRIRAEGGRAELFVGMHGNRNFGFDLSPSLLTALADLSLSLAFDVYPHG